MEWFVDRVRHGVNGLYCFKFKIKQLEANINIGL